MFKKFLSFILLNLSFKTLPMCEYPHNPPVVCLKGKILKSKKVTIKKISCRYEVKVSSYIRPANTYRYDSKLNKQQFTKKTELNIKNPITLYTKDSRCRKPNTQLKRMAFYNCDTNYPTLPDLTLIDTGFLKGPIHDPWTEQRSIYQCQ